MDNFRPLGWRTDALASPAKAQMHGIPDAVRRTRFPFRLLRYWFAHELLVDECRRRNGTPLQVAEVGIDAGQMLAYARQAQACRHEPLPWGGGGGGGGGGSAGWAWTAARRTRR